ncbi:MAG: hypothetical protein K5979_02010 [Ruminococcus sp.]|nr:hypothetical protein [Ruminococcus sp.]
MLRLVEKAKQYSGCRGLRSLPDSKGRAFGRVWDSVPQSFKRSEKGEFLAILKRMAKKREKLCK